MIYRKHGGPRNQKLTKATNSALFEYMFNGDFDGNAHQSKAYTFRRNQGRKALQDRKGGNMTTRKQNAANWRPCRNLTWPIKDARDEYGVVRPYCDAITFGHTTLDSTIATPAFRYKRTSTLHMFPYALAADHIRTWTNPGDVGARPDGWQRYHAPCG